ncbi:MAG: Ig-like domain-containing protein, partial [Planctomycetales bacterium]|nr:Ig-like domain-containing protein [Planctomycetales bacterium]
MSKYHPALKRIDRGGSMELFSKGAFQRETKSKWRKLDCNHAIRRRRLLAESLESRRVLAATVPLTESFEVADLAALTDWSFSGTNTGSVVLDSTSGAHTGTNALRFDNAASFSASTSVAILEFDLSSLSGATDVTFDFWISQTGGSWAGLYYMEVAVSGDGTAWSTLSPSISSANSLWFNPSYDLDARLSDAGIVMDSDVFIRFIHHGYHASHDYLVDDVRIGQGDVLGPQVVSVASASPTAGPLDTIQVSFSEPINSATFTADQITVYGPTGSSLPVAGDPLDSGDQLNFTFALAAPESLAGSYRVQIDPTVEDVNGNKLNQDQ